jgi:hypothetical protein
MMRKRRFFIALGVVMFAYLGSAADAAAEQLPELSVAQPSEAVVEPEQGATKATTELVILDPGDSVPIRVTFKGKNDSPIRVRSVDPPVVEGRGATTLVVTLAGLDGFEDKAASGALVIQGGAAPVAVATKVEPPLDPSRDWMATIVIASLIAMAFLALAVLALAALKKKADQLKNRAPGPKWSFSSWATTLTAVGGVLGTILASVTFPEHPDQIDKESLVGLSLLFAGLVVVAPFVFQSLRNPKATPTDQEGGLWGYNWALLVACSITCGAVLGELACLALLSQELIGASFWKGAALVVVALLALLALYYFFVTAYQLATSTWTVPQATVKAGDGSRSLVIGTAAARAEAGEEGPGQVEVSVAPVQSGWSLP